MGHHPNHKNPRPDPAPDERGLSVLVALLCVEPREKNSDHNPNLTRYNNGGFDIVVDVRPAENYANGHIVGAYNHPGLAFLPSTDDLMSNLGDCKAKNVAVLARASN